ncbi:hypothetical protein [Aquimarina longa]|nr:hypothetical protein [Aquimarina longa]
MSTTPTVIPAIVSDLNKEVVYSLSLKIVRNGIILCSVLTLVVIFDL